MQKELSHLIVLSSVLLQAATPLSFQTSAVSAPIDSLFKYCQTMTFSSFLDDTCQSAFTKDFSNQIVTFTDFYSNQNCATQMSAAIAAYTAAGFQNCTIDALDLQLAFSKDSDGNT